MSQFHQQGGRGANTGGRDRGYSNGTGRGDGGRGGRGDSSGGRGRGFDRGGGGQGFQGGRSGGRDAPGLSGRNRHMGEIQSVIAANSPQVPGMTDADILKVLNPSAADRDRSRLVNLASQPYTDQSVVLPTPAAWRHSLRVGKVFDPSRDVVRSNYFLIKEPDAKSKPTGFYQYAVHIYSIAKETGKVSAENLSPAMDSRESTSLVATLRKNHTEWPQSSGFAFDGKSNLFTSQLLPLTDKNAMGEPYLEENIALKKIDGVSDSKMVFRVTLTLAQSIPFPGNWSSIDKLGLLALENAVLAFAKWQVTADLPTWFLVNSQVFKSSGQLFPLSPAYSAMRGFKLGLRSLRSGLALTADMIVSCFLSGGEMITVMGLASGLGSVDAFLQECRRGLHSSVIARIDSAIGNCKIVLKYLDRQMRKCKFLGPPANSPASRFCDSSGKSMNVAEYYAMMAADKTPAGKVYKAILPTGKLKYPEIPCINIGSEKKPILIPPELVIVPAGQCRQQITDPEISAKHIRYSAVRPDERMRFLFDTTSQDNIINLLNSDATAKAFGVGNVAHEGLAVGATLLPSPKLQYGKGQVIDPRLNGTWNSEGKSVFLSASSFFSTGVVSYAVLLCGSRPPSNPNYKQIVTGFFADLEKDALLLGIKIKMLNTPIESLPDPTMLATKFRMCLSAGAGVVLCVMTDTDIYGVIKLQADQLGLMSQCMKWKNVDRPPKSFHFNIALKLNAKLGGTNHTLVSRLLSGSSMSKSAGSSLFQQPPQSLCWIFDKPCMLLGIDVSHPELGSKKDSAAAVVASMDGMCSQYAAYLSIQSPNNEMVEGLEEAMIHQLKLFRDKNNGQLPVTIVLYRDGVSDGQFDQVISTEIPAIKNAYSSLGHDPSSVKIAAVVCQKRHNAKLAFEEKVAGGVEFVNSCPGLLVDGTSANSICNPSINEFFLNSHAAIQGTAKACKYALIFDEVGFKMAELELMTYWLTYLYSRCNKSVSYATPAYYAHWASRRGKYLFAAGARNEELMGISKIFGDAKKKAIMFYL